MKKTKKALATLAIMGMAATMAPFNVFAATGVTTDRLSGADRFGTAVQVADKFVSSVTATTAILAPAEDAHLVDALASSPLAGKVSPILLTDGNTLTQATKDELIKLKVTKVYVVGAISPDVVTQVNAISSVTAIPLKGADRIGTAAAINAKLTNPAGSFVVGYDALVDALSVASYAAANNYSIVVANQDGSIPITEPLAASNVYLVGGASLVKDMAGATRLSGADRFATNQAVIDKLYPSNTFDKVYVANGTQEHLVDSLVASSLAGLGGDPIVLTDTGNGGDATAVDVNAKLANNAVVVALGSSTVVTDATVAKVTTAVIPAVLAVTSVSAINASQIKVVFTQPVDKTSAENAAANYTVTPAGAIPLNFAVNKYAELQADGVTVILTLPNAYTTATQLGVLVQNVQAKNDATTTIPMYSSSVTINDLTAPTAVSISSSTNGATASTATVTFSEPIVAGAAIKIDGAYVLAATTPVATAALYSSNQVALIGLSLDATKSHTLQVVNLKDGAGNVTALQSLTFNVTVDTVAPTALVATQTDSQFDVTFSKKMTVATVLAGISVKDESYGPISATVTQPDINDATKFNVAINGTDLTNLYLNKTSRVMTLVFANTILDTLGNTMVSTTQAVTLNQDTAGPVVTGLSYKTQSDGKVISVTATFNEKVVAVALPTVVDNNGILKAGFFAGVGVASTNTIVYTLTPAATLSGVWSMTFSAGAAKDLASTPNNNVAYTGTINMGASTSTTFKFDGTSSITTSAAITSGLVQNVITVTYNRAVKGGAVTGSATDPNNYTLNGSVLPAGTPITLDALTQKVATVTLPAGTVAKTDLQAIFTINNVQDTNGTTISAATPLVGVTDDTTPVLQSAQQVGNSIILTFNEKVATPGANIAAILANYTIKCGTSTVIVGTTGVAVGSLVDGDNTKVQITFTTVGDSLYDASKTVTLKTNTTATTTDVAGNVIKSGVLVTATK